MFVFGMEKTKQRLRRRRNGEDKTETSEKTNGEAGTIHRVNLSPVAHQHLNALHSPLDGSTVESSPPTLISPVHVIPISQTFIHRRHVAAPCGSLQFLAGAQRVVEMTNDQ
nr:hypothetical protein Iba_chr06cCG5490 [Ipomoea batatas]GMD77088.1 hypothetical protein Iba_scaffold1552817CG0010 [Ipomoea batatas]